MRHYLFIWIGIAACFTSMQLGHPFLAVGALAGSWLVALFLQPAQRIESFSRHYIAQPVAHMQAAEVPVVAKTL
ncbi:hypothetical protein [Pseudomonas oryzihabitans]|uniref:hypothetical protein n=1 Tax=Pseudomonas oryzihabitans TaxID=47885 RepID=UPI00285D8930|nr:hypothetical protein [Pseudomonas psychrotolerans]MDR6680065.1 hypothetical protein [Pseudomonas psychrotolerans]